MLILGMVAYLAFDVMILWATFHAFGAAPPLAILWIAYLIGELGGLIPVYIHPPSPIACIASTML